MANASSFKATHVDAGSARNGDTGRVSHGTPGGGVDVGRRQERPPYALVVEIAIPGYPPPVAYRKSAREDPAPAPPAALDTFVASAPGEPFALLRRRRRWSTFERRLLGGALCLPCVLSAASPLLGFDFHSNGPLALMMAAALIWFFPVERLFVSTERLTGLVSVRRSVRIRPMPGRAPAGDEVLVDEQLIAVVGSVSVCVLDLSFHVKGGLRSDHVVCLLAVRRLYDVDTFPDERSTDAFVEVLSLALRRAPERARAGRLARPTGRRAG